MARPILKPDVFDENADRCFTCRHCILDLGADGTERTMRCHPMGEPLTHNIYLPVECEEYERG